MERTGTNGLTLLALVKAQTGHVISQSLLSMILSRSRRCSRVNAYALHMVTGVDMDVLTRWDDARISRIQETFRRTTKARRRMVRENANVV